MVGYTTVEVAKNKYHALGIQLTDVSASDFTISIQDLVKGSNPKGWSSLNARADQIHVWNGMAWTKYFYHNTLLKFVKSGETEASTDTLKNGDTVFFLRSSMGAVGDTITLSGGVNLSTTPASVAVAKNKYVFMSYPWPVEFAIADFKNVSSNPKGWTSLNARADQVHRWTGMAWEKYYYNSTAGGYVKNGESEITTDKLEVGEGVFFLRSSMGATGDTITFTKPAGL